VTETPSSSLIDLHGAVSIYVGAQALAGISARATDLLWSELPALRPIVDLTFGYGLALFFFVGHVWLRWQPTRALPSTFAGMALLASLCASQLLTRALFMPQYSVYEGDSLITLLACLATLAALSRHVVPTASP
jgi:hypothetical protein